MRRLALLLSFALLPLSACKAPPKESADTDQAQAEQGGPAAAEAGDPGVPGEPGTPGEATPAACSTAALQPELERMCDYDLGIPPIALPVVEWTAPSYHPTQTSVITLTTAGMHDPQSGAAISIQDWLANPPRRIPEPGVMAIAIANDVPVTAVAELWRGLSAAGRMEIRALVQVTDPEPPPAPRKPEMLSTMKAKLPTDANERAVFVAQGVRGYANACPALAEAFSQLSTVAPEQRCTALAERAAAAVVSCGCEKGDEIMTLLYGLTVGFEPPKGRVAAVPVALDPNRGYTPPEGQTWGELARETFTDTQLHRLWIDAVAAPMPAGG
ncbi:hypothetical protein G6O69_32615 [Pseudenhygromyxa sp. WMMC2535]|uniref:hypothetical protein n=1 Tax=Pseudenhygromyxa sp. WMMC2535 TaxID=2712867 RepID=UPI0015545D77|nr:hypothetical protein [Pseudenhygromyxa sp. WMMC2535]NVB42612.1 hypothetical protein [Pseudenhygromyxa sp. WMMC2535]